MIIVMLMMMIVMPTYSRLRRPWRLTRRRRPLRTTRWSWRGGGRGWRTCARSLKLRRGLNIRPSFTGGNIFDKNAPRFKSYSQVGTDQPLHREVLQVPRERLLHLQRSQGRVNVVELLLWREQHHSCFHRGLSRKWNLPKKVGTSVTSGFHSQVRF